MSTHSETNKLQQLALVAEPMREELLKRSLSRSCSPMSDSRMSISGSSDEDIMSDSASSTPRSQTSSLRFTPTGVSAFHETKKTDRIKSPRPRRPGPVPHVRLMLSEQHSESLERREKKGSHLNKRFHQRRKSLSQSRSPKFSSHSKNAKEHVSRVRHSPPTQYQTIQTCLSETSSSPSSTERSTQPQLVFLHVTPEQLAQHERTQKENEAMKQRILEEQEQRKSDSEMFEQQELGELARNHMFQQYLTSQPLVARNPYFVLQNPLYKTTHMPRDDTEHSENGKFTFSGFFNYGGVWMCLYRNVTISDHQTFTPPESPRSSCDMDTC